MRHAWSDIAPFRRDQLGFFLERGSQGSGAFTRLRMGTTPVWLLRDPDLLKPILSADEAVIDKGRFIQKLRPILGDSSLTFSGEEHLRRRHVFHDAIARGVDRQYVPDMSTILAETAAVIVRKGAFDAHALCAPLMLRMVCLALFGRDALSEGDLQAIVQAVALVEDDVADELFRVLPRLPWNERKRLARLEQAKTMLDVVVRRGRAKAAEGSAVAGLSKLGLDDDAMRAEVVTALIAGHHTTGTAAAFLLYHLATEPALADELALEAASATDALGELDPRRLPQLKKSLGVVREILRLYPAAHWFSRDVKQPVELGGVALKPGEAIIISPWHLHRDPRFWEAPAEFRPERSFATKAYVPFGVGPRACVGMRLAQLELQVLALAFASSLTLTLADPSFRAVPSASVTLVPPSIDLRVEPRAAVYRTHAAA